MMKFVGIALLVAVCVFVTVVEGRKNHKRTVRKEHNREASSRDERHKMMREAQKTRKANMGEPLATNDAAARKERAKLRANSKHNVKIDELVAKKAKRGHNRHNLSHKRREDEAKPHHNHAQGLHQDELHKHFHGKQEHQHFNGARGMKKHKFNHDMLEDLVHFGHVKRVLKKVAEKKGKPYKRVNDSRAQKGKGKNL